MQPQASSGRERVTGPMKPPEERQSGAATSKRVQRILPQGTGAKASSLLSQRECHSVASCWKRMKSSNFKISMWSLSGAVPRL